MVFDMYDFDLNRFADPDKRKEYQTEECCFFALSLNGGLIRYIDNPTEKMKLKAIKNWTMAICYIDNPSKELQRIALEQNVYTVKYIKNLDNDVLLEAVQKEPDILAIINLDEYDQHFLENLQIEAIKKRWNLEFLNKRIYNDYLGYEEDKTEWFHKEINRLKLQYGPMNEYEEHEL